MKLIEDITTVPEEAKGCVLAIGNFDGVHKGHQELLSLARNKAQGQGVPFGVLTFEPHPRALLRPDDPPFRITPPTVKWHRLETFGADFTFALPFNWDFASQTPEQFIAAILTNGMAPSHIVVGDDFRFGQMRKGDTDTLKEYGFDVTVLTKITDKKGEDLSSSRIRSALRHHKIDTANDLLGWEWEIQGTVVKGDQRGRTLGYPTANVHLKDTLHPDYGVYATWVKIIEDGPEAPWMPSATNIGIRPMFEVEVGQVETYIFDFDRDIYGKTLRVKPVKRLRGEARFDNLEGLITQIEKDCQEARQILI